MPEVSLFYRASDMRDAAGVAARQVKREGSGAQSKEQDEQS